jgi:anti-anti-sigma factor
VDEGVSLSTLHVVGDAYVCCVAGDLDDSTADRLRMALDRIQARGGRRVIVDLCAVDFLHPTGLGLLLMTADELNAGGGTLTVVADDPRILRLIETTGSGERLRLERTLSEAMSGVGAGSS